MSRRKALPPLITLSAAIGSRSCPQHDDVPKIATRGSSRSQGCAHCRLRTFARTTQSRCFSPEGMLCGLTASILRLRLRRRRRLSMGGIQLVASPHSNQSPFPLKNRLRLPRRCWFCGSKPCRLTWQTRKGSATHLVIGRSSWCSRQCLSWLGIRNAISPIAMCHPCRSRCRCCRL